MVFKTTVFDCIFTKTLLWRHFWCSKIVFTGWDFLDILNYWVLSNLVADTFDVYHQSPQLLLIKDGECIYEADHLEISVEDLKEELADDFWKIH